MIVGVAGGPWGWRLPRGHSPRGYGGRERVLAPTLRVQQEACAGETGSPPALLIKGSTGWARPGGLLICQMAQGALLEEEAPPRARAPLGVCPC